MFEISNKLRENDIVRLVFTRKIVFAVLWALVGFFSSRAEIFGTFAPFGVSLCAALSLKGAFNVTALIGVIGGYAFSGGESGYINIAVCIAVIALKYFLEKKLGECRLIYCVISAFTFSAAASFLSVPTLLASPLNTLLVIAQATVCATSTYFFSKTIPLLVYKDGDSSLTERDLTCVIVSVSVLLLSLEGFSIYGMSAGRIIGAFLVLCAAYCGSMAYGSMIGVITGLVLSLAGPPQGGYIVGCYAFGGMLAGVFSSFKTKVISAAAFVLSGSLVTLYISGSNSEISSLLEIVVASSLFAVMPQSVVKAVASIFTLKNDQFFKLESDKFKSLLLGKLSRTSKTLTEISEEISVADTEIKPIGKDKALDTMVRCAEQVCAECRMCTNCWNYGYSDTIDVFCKLLSAYSQKEIIKNDDFPGYFMAKCEKPDELAATLNVALTKLYSNQNQMIKNRENKHLLSEQYRDFGNVLDKIREDFRKTVKFDADTEQKMRRYLKRIGFKDMLVWCYSDEDEMVSVEIETDYDKEPEQQISEDIISEIVGCKMELGARVIKDNGKLSLKFCERENYTVSCCSLSNAKNQGSECGDTVSSFRGMASKYILALSDGVGTGSFAAEESTEAVSFLEKLLRAGFDKESALKLLNSAMMIKSEEEGFATVDIASINLINGKAEFIKAGAAPSFVKSRLGVYRLGCSSLPAGMLPGSHFEKTGCKLGDGDMLIMMSDGISALGEKRIKGIIDEFSGSDPQELAGILVHEVKNILGDDDDMTVLVSKITQKAA